MINCENYVINFLPVNDHAENYQKAQTLEIFVEILKSGKKIKYLPIMHSLIEQYQLNVKRILFVIRKRFTKL